MTRLVPKTKAMMRLEGGDGGGSRKRQRTGGRSNIPPEEEEMETSKEDLLVHLKAAVTDSPSPSSSSSYTITSEEPQPQPQPRFNDSATADVKLRVYLESPTPTYVILYLHSDVLRRSQYFSALLSDRWQTKEEEEEEEETGRVVFNLTYKVPSSMESIVTHLKVIELLYSTDDDDNLFEAINTVSSALSIYPVALEFLFEDCVKACLRLIEAFPWSEEEEQRVLSLATLLNQEESQELLSRVSLVKNDVSHVKMLYNLIVSLMNNVNHPGLLCQKGLVMKLMRDFTSRDCVKIALDMGFLTSLNDMKELLEKHSQPSPNIRSTIKGHLIHLCWLVEGMLDFRFVDTAANRWSDRSFTQSLQQVFSKPAFKSDWFQFVPQLIQGTCRLSKAVAFGPSLADRKVRKEMVTHWLPVLFFIRDAVLPALLPALPDEKRFCQQLEETFLKIISTLSLSDSQALLEQFFRNYNDEDSPHLLSAFKTWFRRAATQPPTGEGLS